MAPIALLSNLAGMAAQLTNGTGTNGTHHCGRSVATSAVVSASGSAYTPASTPDDTTWAVPDPTIAYIMVGVTGLLMLTAAIYIPIWYIRRARAAG